MFLISYSSSLSMIRGGHVKGVPYCSVSLYGRRRSVWNTLWIFIDGGSASRMAMGLILCETLKGPYHFGESLRLLVIVRLQPSSQTWSPSLISVSFLLSLRFCTCWRSFWADCLASSRRHKRVSAAGVEDSRCFRITCGLIPIRSSWGDQRATSCFQELWANSATGSNWLQVEGFPDVQGRKYCLIQVFIRSVCPLVQGWKAVERFCWIPSALHISFTNAEVNQGSQSEMILLGSPNQGTRCFRYSSATPVPSIIFVQGMNLAALEQPWSTIVRMESKPCDFGRSVIRSIDTYWKGPSSTGVSKCCRGAFDRCMLVLDSWQQAHPLTYCSTNSLSLGPSYCSQTSSQVLDMPGCPAIGESWRVWRMSHLRSELSSRKILLACKVFVGMKRWSGRRTCGSLVSTPLLRSFLCDNKSATVFVDPGMCSRV